MNSGKAVIATLALLKVESVRNVKMTLDIVPVVKIPRSGITQGPTSVSHVLMRSWTAALAVALLSSAVVVKHLTTYMLILRTTTDIRHLRRSAGSAVTTVGSVQATRTARSATTVRS